MSEILTRDITPQQIVTELDKHIIGQNPAKRAVAVALRNGWRRTQVPEKLRAEIMPKNILMIGPTGVGKTEIARRLAKIIGAPFIKVEATKFTEIGYVGREVESIIRDLAKVAVEEARESAMNDVEQLAEDSAEERILDAVLTPAQTGDQATDETLKEEKDSNATRQLFRKKLREGQLDEKYIDIELSAASMGVEIMAPPGMEEMTSQLQNMFQNMSSDRTKLKRMRIKDAYKRLKEEEAAKLINEEELVVKALENVEQNGMVFIDEIDKLAQSTERRGGEVSREGVQRDLLPLVEGSTVVTKYGMIKTDHITFIAAGAFHETKPSDLIPELQGRLPIRIELDALSADDFERILTEPDASLTDQYIALLAVDGVQLEFKTEGVRRIAEIAWQVNENIENIGARRLHTVLERLLDEVSFDALEMEDKSVLINAAYVDERLAKLAKDRDLSQYIL